MSFWGVFSFLVALVGETIQKSNYFFGGPPISKTKPAHWEEAPDKKRAERQERQELERVSGELQPEASDLPEIAEVVFVSHSPNADPG